MLKKHKNLESYYNGASYDKQIVHNDVAISLFERFFSDKIIALDIGCGTCRKLLSLTSKASKIYGIDCNYSMVNQAKINVLKHEVNNIFPIYGHNFYLPFNDEMFDIASSMFTIYSFAEIHRVLKPGGRICMEILGVNDKKELKEKFGKDDIGWRGILLNQDNDTREKYLRMSMSPFFSDVEIHNVEQEVIMSYKSIRAILEQTPTIRNFSVEKDKDILIDIEHICKRNNGMALNDNRMLVTAIKKN